MTWEEQGNTFIAHLLNLEKLLIHGEPQEKKEPEDVIAQYTRMIMQPWLDSLTLEQAKEELLKLIIRENRGRANW